MKISIKTGVLIAIVTIAAILLFSSIGINIGPFLYFTFLIAVGYIIIDGISNFANRLIDALAKRQAVSNEEINSKIELMMQRMQVIEDKVDKTNAILEKVSE
jgi:ABC-type multidrug transport system fused ATPase/permease subunit